MTIATKEEQLERLGRAGDHVKRAVHHLSLSAVHAEKQDWRVFAQSAINALEAALNHEDPEEVP